MGLQGLMKYAVTWLASLDKMGGERMKTIIAASRNEHKIKEITAITEKYGMKVISRDEAGIPPFEIIEDGTTFEENSLKKAKEIMAISGQITIADDSGLEVDYLNGDPGVYSARYAGENSNDKKNNEKLLSMLDGIAYTDRRARFVSVISIVFPNGENLVARGECCGHILDREEGRFGFGYDPLFIPDGYQRTFAQMDEETKNKISHRAKALKEMERLLSERGEF